MVCKEELFLWFKSLKGSKRIEVMCGLLNMCCPLELRFCATCMEELCSRDYYCLRDEEAKANNVGEISKIKNIWDVHSRSKLIVALSLLRSTNLLCSNVIYTVLAEEMKIESLASSGVLADTKCAEELVLLLTMAHHHPAFTFEQQLYLSDLCTAVENYLQQSSSSTEVDNNSSLSNLLPSVALMSPVLIQDYNAASVYQQRLKEQESSYSTPRNQDGYCNYANITSIKGKAPHKKMAYRIRVALGANKIIDVFKTPYEIAVFHQKLLQSFPQDKYSPNKEKYIPHLPPLINSCGKQDSLSESLIGSLSEYIWQLNSHLPSHIMQSDNVINFFLPPGHVRSTVARNNRNVENLSPEECKSPRLRSLTIYNSHISESSPAKRLENRQRISSQMANPAGQQLVKKTVENGCTDSQSPVINSPMASPYVSPPNSQTNSRSVSPWVHRINERSSGLFTSEHYAFEKLLSKEHLHEYWDLLKHYRLEELQAMTSEELDSIGIPKDITSKIKRIVDSIRSFLPPNGLNNQVISRNSASLIQGTIKTGMPAHNMSNDSSPVCSEYSSPPQSPSPSEICNQNSSNSSSSEDTSGEKSTPCKNRGDISDNSPQDSVSKRLEDNFLYPKNSREAVGCRQSLVSVPVGYGSVQLPVQAHKPSFLPIQCRTNAGLHISSAGVIYDSQFSRVPLPSALTFLPHMPSSQQRSHAGTPERVLSSSTGLPITTLCPFPVMTSSCATAPSATCSFVSNKNGNVTVVTNCVATGNNGIGRQMQKAVQPSHDSESLPKTPLHHQPTENIYTHNSGYILAPSDGSGRSNSVSTSSCLCASSAPRPSPAPSPSLSPASTPQQGAVPVSLPYIGLPYVFHHSIPFIQTHTGGPANGFMQPTALPTAGHSFTYALPNGVSAISPEILYGQAFAAQSQSLSQGNPTLIAPSVSQCYGGYPIAVTASNIGAAHLVKVPTCYNCGKIGHRGIECKEQGIDEICKAGKFHLNYAAAAAAAAAASNKPVESNE